jgi:CHAT domain-containing protein
MAGEFKGLGEPALVLTPPDKGDETDDGLLGASEVAQLKLDADWVILSACNTAAPDGSPGADGLSGLARAFFYAGSRALLVSHWKVLSDASVRLTTGAIDALVREPAIGRAEAVRQSMLRLLDDHKLPPEYAHPAIWAPFSLIGEGGSGR